MIKRILLLGCMLSGLLFTVISVQAAEDLTPAEMLKKGLENLQTGNYEQAADMLYMYLGEVEESQALRVISIAQDIRFKLATALISLGRLDEAAELLQTYVDTPLAEHPRQAMRMLVTCYYENDAFAECVTAVTNALEYNENPVLEADRVVKSKGDGEEEYRSLSKKEPEPEYTEEELITLHMTQGESHYNIDQWLECIVPFTYVIENTPNEQLKGRAIMQIINALIEIPDFKRIMEWIPQLYRTSARYDIRVNLALMNAAAALYEEEEYDSALPLYRMILPREELITYQEERVREMRIDAGLPPELGEEMTADEMMLFGVADTTDVQTDELNVETGLLEQKPKELIELEELIVILKDLPPYELDVAYRMADLYKVVDRFWEALKFFDKVYTVDPESEVGERSIYEIVDMLIKNLNDIAEAELRGFDHMSKYPRGVTPRQIAYMITGYHQKGEDWKSVKRGKPYLDKLARTNDITIVKYDAELYFVQAIANLVLQNYEEAEAGFRFVLDEFPSSHQEANSLYWYAMSKLFLEKYEEAQQDFELYISRFPQENYVDQCHLRVGVCLSNMEKFEDAKKRYTLVIDTFPDSSAFPEACCFRGDILGSEGLLDEAVADYEKAFTSSKKPNSATWATFQMAEIYEAEDKYEDIIRVVERYLEVWKDDAKIDKALFWIGKTKIQQKLYDEAVDTYIDTIIKYGGNLLQDGVDLMINELVKINAVYLDSEQQQRMLDSLQSALEAADNMTLKLRLRVALAKLNLTELDLGLQLIKELPDLEHASPPVLATICDASFENEDYSRAEELLRIFLNKFEESEFMRAAYKLRANGQYAEKDYEGALDTIGDAQALYGTEYDVAWAQIMKSQILYEQGILDGEDGAREANMMIRNVRAWRGAPVAQATYQLGQVEEKAGNLKKAFAWYQRAYFQYKGHSGGYWAAEGYLASARVLKKLGPDHTQDVRNTYRAMLFDRYVNTLQQAEIARKALGAVEVADIETYLEGGGISNITIKVETEAAVTNVEAEVTATATETNATEELSVVEESAQ